MWGDSHGSNKDKRHIDFNDWDIRHLEYLSPFPPYYQTVEIYEEMYSLQNLIETFLNKYVLLKQKDLRD